MKHRHRVVTLVALLLCVVGEAAARQGGASRPGRETQASPPGWSETLRKAVDLESQGRVAEVVPIYEKWIADYPNFAVAHIMLAGAHEQLGKAALRSHAPDAANIAATQFEIAVVQYRRAVDLTPSSEPMSSDPLGGLLDVYGPLELNRPAEYERLVAEGLQRHPADPFAHAYAIMQLARKGEPIDAAVRAARAAIPKTAHARTELASVLMGFVRDDRESVGVSVAAAALGLVNDALTLDPDDINTLEQKAEILRTQARRASEPERTKLLAEEGRVRARVAELRHRGDRARSLASSGSTINGQSREELSATASLRAIFSAEAAYSAVCITGGFATSLDDLARPDRKDGSAFIMRDLSANGATRDGYKLTVSKGARKDVSDVSTAAATCNGSKRNPASSFFASAEPTDPSHGDRFFAVDERGIIFFSDKPIRNPIVESATVIRYQ